MQRIIFATLLLACSTLVPAAELRLATTTSTENSGLLKAILPVFEGRHNVKVRVIAVGTGKALKLGENGDVDVVLVHSRPDEDRFVTAGFGTERRDVMYNDFVMVGPRKDPAKVRGLKKMDDAMNRMFESPVTFVSRGDDSGTHKAEQALWQSANIRPESAPQRFRYLGAGQGMGAVLGMANSLQAYTLTDRGTYVAYRTRLELDILVEGVPALMNPYGVIPVNPARHHKANHAAAMQFAEWITSAEGQRAIASFKVNGEQLFFPGRPPV